MSESSVEKEKDLQTAHSARRISHMSVEDPLSPASSCGDSISDASSHNHDYNERTLRPHLSRTLSRTSSTAAVGGIVPTELHKVHTNRSAATTATIDPAFEIDFEDGERADPQNWPLWYKGMVLFVMSFATTCVVLYSTSYTSAIPGLMQSFGVSDTTGNLGLTTYLLGMATGAVILAPLSEVSKPKTWRLIVVR